MDRPVRLLALGRFDVTKGFDVLIKACGILRDKGLDSSGLRLRAAAAQ